MVKALLIIIFLVYVTCMQYYAIRESYRLSDIGVSGLENILTSVLAGVIWPIHIVVKIISKGR